MEGPELSGKLKEGPKGASRLVEKTKYWTRASRKAGMIQSLGSGAKGVRDEAWSVRTGHLTRRGGRMPHSQSLLSVSQW